MTLLEVCESEEAERWVLLMQGEKGNLSSWKDIEGERPDPPDCQRIAREHGPGAYRLIAYAAGRQVASKAFTIREEETNGSKGMADVGIARALVDMSRHVTLQARHGQESWERLAREMMKEQGKLTRAMMELREEVAASKSEWADIAEGVLEVGRENPELLAAAAGGIGGTIKKIAGAVLPTKTETSE